MIVEGLGAVSEMAFAIPVIGFGLAEALAIMTAAKSLFGGGEGEQAGELQTQIGQALLKQFQESRAITGPFERDLGGAIRKRQGQTLPLNRIKIPQRRNPLANRTRSSGRPVGTALANPQQASVGSFLSRKAQGQPRG